MRIPSALNHERRHPVFTKKMSVAILPASSKIAFAGSCTILWGMSCRISSARRTCMQRAFYGRILQVCCIPRKGSCCPLSCGSTAVSSWILYASLVLFCFSSLSVIWQHNSLVRPMRFLQRRLRRHMSQIYISDLPEALSRPPFCIISLPARSSMSSRCLS